MEVRVLFFGMLKDVARRESECIVLPDNSTVANLLDHYIKMNRDFDPFVRSIAISVNQQYATRGTTLNQGDEVGFLPPVSGGLPPSAITVRPRATIVRERINSGGILAEMKHPSDGAAVVFEGVVRNHTGGRRTLYLDYEAYEEMALTQMESLATHATANFKIRDARIVHRLGRLEIGETSVLIAVFSGHRSAAFDACRWLIDTLKRTVPIWKKEYFEDGAVWVDGEPFPDEIVQQEGTH